MQREIDSFFGSIGQGTLLLVGDAQRILPLLPRSTADTCLTSPPYWAQRQYSNGGIGNERKPNEYVDRLCDIFRLVRAVLKPEGSLWLNLGDAYRDKNLLGLPWQVAFALQKDGWVLRNAVVWDKLKGNPCNAPDKLRNTYEMVFHFVTRTEYYYDHEAIRTPPRPPRTRNRRIVTPTGVSGAKYERQIAESPLLSEEERAEALKALRGALAKVADGTMPDFRMVIRGYQRVTHSDSLDVSGRANELRTRGFYILPYHAAGTKPGDVWRIVPEDAWRKDAHFAVFPEDLCDIPIRATCPADGIVLDPFAGTGTALVRALALGRRAVGIEISPEYAQVARQRIADREENVAAARQQRALPI